MTIGAMKNVANNGLLLKSNEDIIKKSLPNIAIVPAIPRKSIVSDFVKNVPTVTPITPAIRDRKPEVELPKSIIFPIKLVTKLENGSVLKSIIPLKIIEVKEHEPCPHNCPVVINIKSIKINTLKKNITFPILNSCREDPPHYEE